MTKVINILHVPENYGGPVDSAIDKVVEDSDRKEPKVSQKTISEEGETAVDRALVSSGTHSVVAQSFTDYQNAVDEYSNASTEAEQIAALQKQTEALEVIVAHLWDVTSGENLGSASTQ